MNIDVAYNGVGKQFWMNLEVDNGCVAIDAIKQSGILEKCPEIDLDKNKIGIYGKFIKQDTILNDGDRVEIYRPITADPKTVPRRDQEEG